jgi:GntR family transcriptional regulator
MERNGLPRYLRLADELRTWIRASGLPPRAKLPTEAELCARYGFSRGTVVRALELLERQGLIAREQGRGTFVAPPRPVHGTFRILDFSEDMRARGKTPGTRVLRVGVERPTAELAARLRLPRGERVIRIERLRLADGDPMALETRYLAYSTCPELLGEDLERESIHRLLIEKYRLPLVRAQYTISAAVLDARDAALLATAPGTPGFRVERLTFTVGDRPVTWMVSLYRGDQYRFTAELGPLPPASPGAAEV